MFWFIWLAQSKFNAIYACERSLFHYCMRKFGSTVKSVDLKYPLNVWIASSDALAWWVYRGISWWVIFVSAMASFKYFEHFLTIIYVVGLHREEESF